MERGRPARCRGIFSFLHYPRRRHDALTLSPLIL